MDWNPRDYISILEECWYRSNGIYQGAVSTHTSGTGASAQEGTDVPGRAGIINLDTGSTTSGYAALFNDGNLFRSSGGVWTFQTSFKINDLSAAGERFTVVSGWRDDATVATAVQYGCYFRYSDNVNSGRWQFVCETAGFAENAQDTGVAATAGWVQLAIVLDVDNDLATAYIDDTEVATETDPDLLPLSAFHMSPVGIYKSSGTTRREVEIDYYRYAAVLASPR